MLVGEFINNSLTYFGTVKERKKVKLDSERQRHRVREEGRGKERENSYILVLDEVWLGTIAAVSLPKKRDLAQT